MEYFIICIFVFWIAMVVQKHHNIRLFGNMRHFIHFWIPVIVFGALWDNFAVYRGHWIYPGKGLLGPFLFYIPIEDYIFMISVTYIILVGYLVTKKTWTTKRK